MNLELFILEDETRLQTRLELGRALVSLLFFTVGSYFSLVAAAAAKIVEAVFGLSVYKPHIQRFTATTSARLWRIYAKGSALTLAAILPSLVLMLANDWSPRTPVLHIVAAILSGGAIWLAVAVAIGHPLSNEIRRILTSRKASRERSI